MSRYTPRSSVSQINQPYSRGRTQSVVGQNTDYEEFASLQLDKPNDAELKTSEEMKKHMFDDHFEGRPIERAMHILTVGEEVQKLSVIRDLPQLIVADEEGCMQRVIQKIQQALSNATTEFHIETARSYSVILQKKAVSPNVFALNFLPSVIYHIDNRDQVASNAWLETLLNATEVLPLDIVKSNILGVAINKGQISQNVAHRIAACKLLGKISSRFESQIVKKDILPVVLSLCQDVNETVRACICSQLHIVARGIPPDMIKSALIPILVELGRDETVQVRVEATETIVKIIPFLNQELIKISIIPLIKKICEQAVLAIDETLVMVAKQFGSLCISLEGILTPAEKLWMVSYYHNISHLGIPLHGTKKDNYLPPHSMDRINARYIECRQYCAYNFPAMAKFCCSSPELLEKIYPSLCDFSTDPYYMVRKTIGAGMHEVARILGKNNRVVKNQVMTLLWDSMEEVLMGIVPNLGKTIEHLISSGVLGHEQDGVSFELGRGLLQCDKTIRDKTHNWRLYTDFITQLESIVKCLPSDYIYSHFVTLMFDKMHRARPLPCRLAAARTLLVFLRFNLKSNQRQEIRSRLQSEFCLSSSCYKRMLYLRLCNTAREVFSRAYFKEHFFYPLLSRSEDKVANNRLQLVRQFPSLKAMIVMPSEKKYLQTLETCIRSMAVAEKDRDVMAELRSLIHRLDKTETLSDTGGPPTAEDMEDRRKFEEEMRVANNIFRTGVNVQMSQVEARRVQRDPKAQATSQLVSQLSQKPNGQRPGLATGGGGPSSSSSVTPSNSPRTERVAFLSTTNHPGPTSLNSASTTSSIAGGMQGFINTTNNLLAISALSSNTTNSDQNCTCYPTPYFRSENLRNLNLLALIDTNLVNSKQKFSEILQQKLSEYPRLKMSKSSKHSMEISWLNLELDLKNELLALVRNRQIHGDRNFKEKSKFLTDFRHYNESNLSKFIVKSEDKEYKETIYNVTGMGVNNCDERNDSNFFEERLNFFERKLKPDKSNAPNIPDCSCYGLTTNRTKPTTEPDETKRISYFSKNFKDDFYRDAGVDANEIIGKKFSYIPVYGKSLMQISSPKVPPVLANKRKTWLEGDTTNLSGPVKLETITGYSGKPLERKKSETLPSKERASLKSLGIGPRSKSFILPSTLISSDKKPGNGQLTFSKQNAAKADIGNIENGEPRGAVRPEPEKNRFGFHSKSREVSPKPEGKVEKPMARTKIPVGRVTSGSSPANSRSASPIPFKESTNDIKRIPTVVSRKSMLIPTNSSNSEMKNNRRSLDSTKISLANMDSGLGSCKRRTEKPLLGSKAKDTVSDGEVRKEKGELEISLHLASSKLPIR
ncbi:hypothetical protein RUM43_001309 [Polyplax serrata]|uniref:Serine/threonine-protein phosphatase 4 regulatory subunit 4 n=1 Tax=Polyplax serrata TaxID=468196 RepID=A0AAN8SDM3_POLSC